LYIIYIRNYRKRLFYLSVIVLLWIILLIITEIFVNTSLTSNVIIDNSFSFSYPVKYDIESIYINDTLRNSSIQTSGTLLKPLSKRFSTYKSIEGEFSFKYPSAFLLNDQKFEGSEILYHIAFKDKGNPKHGFVQVWNLPYDLNEFLQNSLSYSDQKYKQFDSKTVSVDGITGVYWDYSITNEENKAFKGSEVFFKKDDRMYRISYFVPEHLWSKKEKDVFLEIVNSFKVY